MSSEPFRILVVGSKDAGEPSWLAPLRARGAASWATCAPGGVEAAFRAEAPDAVVVLAPRADPLHLAAVKCEPEDDVGWRPWVAVCPASVEERARLLEVADGWFDPDSHPDVVLAQLRCLLRRALAHGAVVSECERLREERRQIRTDLELGGALQRSLLPRSLPAGDDIRFGALYLPCGLVSGDIYQVRALDRDRTAFYVADAIGHGVRAALLTVFLERGLHGGGGAAGGGGTNGHGAALPPAPDGTPARVPEQVLARLNRDLMGLEVSEAIFVTMCYGVVDRTRREVVFASAGHPPPLLVRRDGTWSLQGETGLLLGFQDERYASESLRLDPGDRLFIYTDGIDHARFGAKTGVAALAEAVLAEPAMPIARLLSGLAAKLFADDDERPDDATVLGLEIGGASHP